MSNYEYRRMRFLELKDRCVELSKEETEELLYLSRKFINRPKKCAA